MAPQEAAWCEMNFTHNNLFDNTAAREDLEGARRTVEWLEENGKLDNSDDFPKYDQIIETWQQAVGTLTEVS